MFGSPFGNRSGRSTLVVAASAFCSCPVPIHAPAVGERDRAQVARVRIVPVRRAGDPDALAGSEHVCVQPERLSTVAARISQRIGITSPFGPVTFK